MRRWTFFAYGVVCHLLFLATFVYMIGFVGNLLVPKSIDSEPGDWWSAVIIDLALIALFALQHSVMARPAFKRLWTRWVPQPIERSTYVLLSCVVLFVLMWQWRGIDAVVWNLEDPLGRGLLWVVFGAGWLLVPAVTLMISHFDLFGTRQVWLNLLGQKYTSLPFRTPMLYARMRHPLYVGWMVAFWATPTMTVGHLLFAGTLSVYMVLVAFVEERDLVEHFGETYREYQRKVPMFMPRVGDGEEVAGEPTIPPAVHPETLAR